MKTDKQLLMLLFFNIPTRVHAFAWILVGDRHAGKDVFQETSEVVVKRCGEFEAGTNFEAWVMEAAKRKVLEKRRQLDRQPVHLSDAFMGNLQDAYAQAKCGDYEL